MVRFLNGEQRYGSLAGFLFVSLVTSYSVGGADEPYQPGFSWNRLVDYDRGTRTPFDSEDGFDDGNPNTDAKGSGVWQYEGTVIDLRREPWALIVPVMEVP